MTGTGRIIGFAAFGLLAIGLIGYSLFTARERILDMESQIHFLQSSEQDAWRNYWETTGAFHTTIRTEEIFSRIDRITEAPEPERRHEIAGQIVENLSGLYAKFPEGNELIAHLYAIVEGENEFQRSNARQAYLEFVDRITGFNNGTEPIVEAPVVIEPETAEAVSTLVAAFGGLVSALISVAMFFLGGGRRNLEEEMLSLEVEMKRLEVDQFRNSIAKSSKGQAI